MPLFCFPLKRLEIGILQLKELEAAVLQLPVALGCLRQPLPPSLLTPAITVGAVACKQPEIRPHLSKGLCKTIQLHFTDCSYGGKQTKSSNDVRFARLRHRLPSKFDRRSEAASGSQADTLHANGKQFTELSGNKAENAGK